MSKIFISYRRNDSKDLSGRIFDHLVLHFGSSEVFKDVYSIPLGRDFREIIRKNIESSEVMLVIIGRNWISQTDNQNKRRIDNKKDFVRVEIEEGIKKGIPIIQYFCTKLKYQLKMSYRTL